MLILIKLLVIFPCYAHLPVVVVALDRLLQHLPGARLLPHLDVRVGEVVPHLEVLKRDLGETSKAKDSDDS